MSDEKPKKSFSFLFGGITISAIFAIVKLLGYLPISWLVVFSPAAAVIALSLIAGMIYAAVTVASEKLREDIKKDIEEALDKNTNITFEAITDAQQAIEESIEK